MNLLNQSISPHGRQVLFPAAAHCPSAQAAPQHLPMAQRLHPSSSMKPDLQPNPPVPTTSTVAAANIGGPASDVDLKPPTASFLRSMLDDDKSSSIKSAVGGGLDLFSPEHSFTLTVTVASAVKLQRRQMDQIAKKMQRLTGFKNLRMENTVDPSLIAGFVISYGTGDAHVIDLSVRGQLAELTARLESSDERIANQSQGWNLSGQWELSL